MKFLTLAAIAATLIAEASATGVWSVSISGSDQGPGPGKYIRHAPTSDPVKNLTSLDMRCGPGGLLPVPSYVQVPAGGAVTTVWSNNSQHDDIIESSHKGPITAYLAFEGLNGVGDAWSKIFQEGYDGTWAVDKLLSSGGKLDIPIPSGLRPGLYILRSELIALQDAESLYSENPANGAQFSVSCIQIQITGEGDKTLPSGVPFPGAYTDTTPGIKWNINDASIDQKTYPIPGPDVVTL